MRGGAAGEQSEAPSVQMSCGGREVGGRQAAVCARARIGVFRYVYRNQARCMSDAADELLPEWAKVGARNHDGTSSHSETLPRRIAFVPSQHRKHDMQLGDFGLFIHLRDWNRLHRIWNEG